jgi:hypothetical protein
LFGLAARTGIEQSPRRQAERNPASAEHGQRTTARAPAAHDESASETQPNSESETVPADVMSGSEFLQGN